MKHYTLFAILTIGLISCNSDSKRIDPLNYIPLDIGSYIIYDVKDETYYASSSSPIIKYYQEKDVIMSSQNGNSYLIARYSRINSSVSWQKDKEFTIDLLPDKFLETIDNKTYIQMIFPIDTIVKWNGNTYNSFESKQYQYSELAKPSQIGNQLFTNTIKVIQDDYFNLSPNILNLHRTIRQYAAGIGLVYEQENALEYCQETEDCIGEEIIDSGSRKTRSLLEYVNNN